MSKNKLSVPKTEQHMIQDGLLAERCANFGINMRKARKELGLTSSDLANFLGLSPAFVGLIERGERTPSIETLLKICDQLGQSVDSMMTSAENNPQANKNLKMPTTKLERKQRAASNMIKTFDSKELGYIIDVMKGLKTLGKQKENDDVSA